MHAGRRLSESLWASDPPDPVQPEPTAAAGAGAGQAALQAAATASDDQESTLCTKGRESRTAHQDLAEGLPVPDATFSGSNVADDAMQLPAETPAGAGHESMTPIAISGPMANRQQNTSSMGLKELHPAKETQLLLDFGHSD